MIVLWYSPSLGKLVTTNIHMGSLQRPPDRKWQHELRTGPEVCHLQLPCSWVASHWQTAEESRQRTVFTAPTSFWGGACFSFTDESCTNNLALGPHSIHCQLYHTVPGLLLQALPPDTEGCFCKLLWETLQRYWEEVYGEKSHKIWFVCLSSPWWCRAACGA